MKAKVFLSFLFSALSFQAMADAACGVSTSLVPAESSRGEAVRINMSKPNDQFHINIPRELVPLPRGLNVEFREGVCDKVNIRYNGEKLTYRIETTCEGFSTVQRVSMVVNPNLSVLEKAEAKNYAGLSRFFGGTTIFKCGSR